MTSIDPRPAIERFPGVDHFLSYPPAMIEPSETEETE